ncbi:hypothetical protein GF391_04245 [Candidatus Uhrbacteria bacterium]|nr:hypothetical protein [Candidatus Uhrbacteria bacterium]
MKGISLSAAFIAIVSLALFGAGCNPFQSAQEKAEEKAAEKMTEKMLESMGGENVDVDVSDGGDAATVKIDNEDGSGEMMFGDEVELPDDLSDSVLIYDDATPMSVIRNLGGNRGAMITLKTDASIDDAADWYAEQYKDAGWEQEQTVSLNDTKMLGFTKDGEEVLVTFGPDEKDGDTMISINWSVDN